jgi:hypothetical protein
MTHSRLLCVFIYTAGTSLLTEGLGLLISLICQDGFAPLHDPLLTLPMPTVFLIFGAVSVFVGLGCLFGSLVRLKLYLVAWFALSCLVYQMGLFFAVGPLCFIGYWGSLPETFSLSPSAGSWIFALFCLYLFIGSTFSLICRWKDDGIDKMKGACSACGGHIEFPSQNLGQKVSCPHCQQTLALRQGFEWLKISCFFCGGHIEFPAHAVGEKMRCPHCKMDLILRRQTAL